MTTVELKTGKVTIKPLIYNPVARADTQVTVGQRQMIKSLIGNYEKKLINAINQNDFSIVESLLTPGSNLYKSQKNLVVNLNKKRIREKLVDYQVMDIQTFGEDGVYKVYVHEKIAIQYPDKSNFRVMVFDWIYTVVTDGKKLSLSEIEKWKR